MSNVSVEQIKQLREQTGVGMMDCKRALEQCNGDFDKAVVFLRKEGLADIQTRGSKTTNEGMVGHYIHAGGKIGVLVEVNCETDFVARGEDFQKFTKELAMHIAALNPKWISRDEVPEEIIEREKEIISDSLTNKPPQVVDQIIKGKLNKFFKETCLVDQPFVRDANLTVQDLLGELASKIGEKLVIKRFVRYVTGE